MRTEIRYVPVRHSVRREFVHFMFAFSCQVSINALRQRDLGGLVAGYDVRESMRRRVTLHARFNEHFRASSRRILTSVELRHCKVFCDTVPAVRNRAASEWMFTQYW